MIGRFLLSAATAVFLSLSAGAVTTSQDIDITVTHGTPPAGILTTFTFANNSGNTLPAGSPVSFGQAFRYGDITPGTYPLIRDAATHVALPGQQWDEISTWRENGGNSSWRHAVWAAWLPKSLANGATYQIEFVATAGTYSQSAHQALSALCSGPAAHDLKIHLTDVRNQNEMVRDSGDATFRLCDNITNAGRDAPRHLRAGNVYDEYQVNGMFVYATSGHKDPLLYAQCNVDIFTKASDGVSAGDVRWVCHVHNSFMNVAAGSTGNAGNPGPAGFANDPQAVSYRPEVDDGASVVLDWSGLDATITSASNPIEPTNAGHCETGSGDFCMHVPSSTGKNAWYMGQAVRVSCSGTCVAGLTNDLLTYVYPSSVAGMRDVTQTQYVSFSPVPKSDHVFFMTGSQGTGSTSFSFRVQHYHWETWQTLDWSGQNNWSPFGTTTRVTRKVYPAFTTAEKLYWEQSGIIVPINVAQQGVDIGPAAPYGAGLNYEPMGRLNVIGFQGPSYRADLGIAGEFAASALINGTEKAWDLAREFSLGSSMHGANMMLNEATGRIPAINNGPPVGPGGNGTGGSYAELGAPMPQVQLESQPQLSGLADVPHNQPNPAYDIAGGTFNYGTYLSHRPNFNGFTYIVFGDRHFLDMMRWNGNADYAEQRPGPGPELGMGYYRDNNATFTDGRVYHYYGLMISCCQTRGSAWLMRDIIYPATFGSDNDIERSYFYDFIQETTNYYPLFEKYKDGPGNSNWSKSILPPDNIDEGSAVSNFMMGYVGSVAYIMSTWLHAPLGDYWEGKFQRYYEGVCGGQLPGSIPPFYCIQSGVNPATVNGDPGTTVGARPYGYGGNIGQFFNGVDATDFGTFSYGMQVLAGGALAENVNFDITPGDKLKMVTSWWDGVGVDPIDQLPGDKWFEIMAPIDNSQYWHTFHVRCPVGHAVDATCPTPGQAFTSWTRNGADISGTSDPDAAKLHPQFDPGPNTGFANPNYMMHGGQGINGLHILGYKVDHARAAFVRQCGNGDACYSNAQPQFNWDPTVVVPGLPTPHNGL